MRSSPCWVKDNLSNGQISYFAISNNQSPCDRNSSSIPSPCAVSDVSREEGCGTGVEHGSSPGMEETWYMTRKGRLRPVLLRPSRLSVGGGAGGEAGEELS